MLLFISDLHVMDEGFKEAIPMSRLASVVDGIVQRALDQGVKDIELVLLGDIFEIIKSQQWIDHGVRPWEPCTARHQEVVSNIFASILAANPKFVAWLSGLPLRHPQVRLTYIPGNHDLVVNTEMGSRVRPRLRALLTQPASADKFKEEIRDSRHSVLALHGHEWDSNNRSGARGGPFGDAIVIEVLVRLPLRMAEKLQMRMGDDGLDFLFELDNVRPQTQGGMARWLESGLLKVCADRRDIEQAFDDVFDEILEALWALGRTNQFEAYRSSSRWERWLARGFTKMANARGLHRLMRLFPLQEGSRGHYPDHVRGLLQSAEGVPPRYFLCGHTHIPEHVPLLSGRDGRSLYMNSGTWRRVHVPRNFDRPSSAGWFASHQEECVVSIFDVEEQKLGLPAYEFYRTVHGLG